MDGGETYWRRFGPPCFFWRSPAVRSAPTGRTVPDCPSPRIRGRGRLHLATACDGDQYGGRRDTCECGRVGRAQGRLNCQLEAWTMPASSVLCAGGTAYRRTGESAHRRGPPLTLRLPKKGGQGYLLGAISATGRPSRRARSPGSGLSTKGGTSEIVADLARLAPFRRLGEIGPCFLLLPWGGWGGGYAGTPGLRGGGGGGGAHATFPTA